MKNISKLLTEIKWKLRTDSMVHLWRAHPSPFVLTFRALRELTLRERTFGKTLWQWKPVKSVIFHRTAPHFVRVVKNLSLRCSHDPHLTV